jgi:SAM-dependent methyltransferase
MPKKSTQIRKALRTWLSEPLGQSLLEEETQQLAPRIEKLFGYHLLVLGEPQFLSCMTSSPILHRVWVHPEIAASTEGNPLNARQDKLPIISDEIDVVFLAHCLEAIHNPHEVVREAYRVLKPEGHIIITGFNPWSSWGIWRGLVRYIKKAPWDGRFISLSRVKDWLALLGFDITHVQTCYFRPPVTNAATLRRLKWLEWLGRWVWPFWGGTYIVFAQKRVMTLTPIRPTWEKPNQLLPVGLGEPVSRVKRDTIKL